MKRRILLFASLLSLFSVFTSTTEAVVLYRQVFGLADGDGNDLLSAVNWGAYSGASSNLQEGSGYYCLDDAPSAPNTVGLENVNSSVTAASLTHGIGVFYIRSSGQGDIYIPNATEQAAFGTIDYDAYQSLDFSVYANKAGRSFRFIIEIATSEGPVWIATDSYGTTGSWEEYTLNYTEDASQWYLLDFTPDSGDAISISEDTLAAQSIAFPEGVITNFGILVDGPRTSGISFDGYEVSGVPEPATYAAICAGAMLIALCLRRRRS